jgi:hypothetical protein
MSAVERLHRVTVQQRVEALEKRAEHHDRVIPPMAEQLAELYGAWSKLKTINWFFVKLVGYGGGSLGAVAVLLTIYEKASAIFHH